MIVVPTSHGFAIGASAALIGQDDTTLRAWAERHVRKDPDLRWILGNYVEADEANSNGHIFPLSELVHAQHTVAAKPLNMLHREHYIVGYFAGAQLLHANGVEFHAEDTVNTTDSDGHPYVEALAALWHTRFPEEFFQIQRAHKEGSLFFSMEAIPETVACPTCDHEAVFAGLESDTYCSHMQGATGPKMLRNPVFSGGAIIIPPVRPGWERADIKTISKLMESPGMDKIYGQITNEAPALDPRQWEWLMAQIVKGAAPGNDMMNSRGMAMAEGRMPMNTPGDVAAAVKAAPGAKDPATAKKRVKQAATRLKCENLIPAGWDAPAARDFSQQKRDKMAKQGTAMPDGSYPIANEQDLRNAIHAIGRAKDPAATRAHIKKRAKALGLEELIPEGW